MMRTPVMFTAFATLLNACGSGTGSGGDTAAVVRDSAGITITEYSASAWEAAPDWELSAEPIAVVGDDVDDVSIDLSTANIGTLFDDGTMLAATAAPMQIYRFNEDGSLAGTVGRAGEGPGEYQQIGGMNRLGGDSVVVLDLFKRVGLLFSSAGDEIGRIQFPISGTFIPPILNGRLTDATWVMQIISPLQEPEEDAPEIYRLDGPILSWREGNEAYDTLFMIPGAEMTWGSYEAAGGSQERSRPVGYGSNTFIGVQGSMVWSTTGDRFVIQGHNSDGTLVQEVRVETESRPVTEADRDHYKQTYMEQLERVAALLPPGLMESERSKIDDTPFATHHPEIGLLGVDGEGRLWVTTDFPVLDSLLTWGIFSAEGELLGKVEMPQGTLFAASADKVVVRREDDETGLVLLEVFGINQAVCEECGQLVD